MQKKLKVFSKLSMRNITSSTGHQLITVKRQQGPMIQSFLANFSGNNGFFYKC